MKFHCALFIIILFVTSFESVGQIRSNKDIIGKWSASGLRLEFFPDGRLSFIIKGGSIPGARYRTDFMQNPPVLYIELVNERKMIVYRSTVEFITGDSFRLTKLDNDPANTFEKQRSIILKKEGRP